MKGAKSAGAVFCVLSEVCFVAVCGCGKKRPTLPDTSGIHPEVGIKAAEAPLVTERDICVQNGYVVLVKKGAAYGAFILREQKTTPETASYDWYYREDGSGNLDPRDENVTSGAGTGTRVVFGPFSMDWCPEADGESWVSYFAIDELSGEENAVEICATPRESVVGMDAASPQWDYTSKDVPSPERGMSERADWGHLSSEPSFKPIRGPRRERLAELDSASPRVTWALWEIERGAYVPDGHVVLLKKGTAYGAFILSGQKKASESMSYGWYYRKDGRGALDIKNENVKSGSGKGNRVRFGPFDVEWSPHSDGVGRVYYAYVDQDTRAERVAQVCATNRGSVEGMDAAAPEWKYIWRDAASTEPVEIEREEDGRIGMASLWRRVRRLGVGEEGFDELLKIAPDVALTLREADSAVQVPDGRVVLVKKGETHGAFVLREQKIDPETMSYEWCYRRDGRGTFDAEGRNAESGTGKGKSVRFGPFEIEWSGCGEGIGWIYFDMTKEHARVEETDQICVTRRESMEGIDATSHEWKYFWRNATGPRERSMEKATRDNRSEM